jgi:hypothetical protein
VHGCAGNVPEADIDWRVVHGCAGIVPEPDVVRGTRPAVGGSLVDSPSRVGDERGHESRSPF